MICFPLVVESISLCPESCSKHSGEASRLFELLIHSLHLLHSNLQLYQIALFTLAVRFKRAWIVIAFPFTVIKKMSYGSFTSHAHARTHGRMHGLQLTEYTDILIFMIKIKGG